MCFYRVLLVNAEYSYFPLWDPLLTGGEGYVFVCLDPVCLLEAVRLVMNNFKVDGLTRALTRQL